MREYRVVDGKNCYSDSTIATLVVSACEALAPTAKDIYVCLGDAGRDQTITATRNANSTISASHLSWLSIDPVGTTGSASDASVLTTVGTNSPSYNPSVAVNAVKDFPFYVAEYDEENSCWSAGTKVTVHVVDTPSVSITSPADFCAVGSEPVAVTVNPQTGTLTSSTGTISGFNWLPGDYAGDKLETVLTYVVESSAYADATTCTSTVKSETTAHFMEAPTANPTTWLIGDIDGVPALTGELTSTGAEMTWYANQTMMTQKRMNPANRANISPSQKVVRSTPTPRATI